MPLMRNKAVACCSLAAYYHEGEKLVRQSYTFGDKIAAKMLFGPVNESMDDTKRQ
jgi:hypothetical protein